MCAMHCSFHQLFFFPRLQRFPESLTVNEVSARSHLYMASLSMHLSWGAIAAAIAKGTISILLLRLAVAENCYCNCCNSFLAVLSFKGYVCEKITREMNDYDTRMQLLPTLSQAVMMTKRYVRSKVLLKFDGCTT